MFKAIFNFFRNLFKKTTKPAPQIESATVSQDVIGLVIGHNREAQGAEFVYNGNTVSEYNFYKHLLSEIQPKLNFKSIIIERPTGSYSKQVESVERDVIRNHVTSSIHFHFNSSDSSKSNGFECLVLENVSQKMFHFCQALGQKFNEVYGSRLRHDSGVLRIGRHHNGYLMLSSMESNHVDAVLIEPFFSSNSDSVEAVYSNTSKFCQCLIDVLNNQFGESADK